MGSVNQRRRSFLGALAGQAVVRRLKKPSV